MKNILYTSQRKYLESLRSEIDPVIKKIEEYAAEHKIPILNWDAAEFLEQLILIHRPKKVLEIGTAIGYSSIRIVRRLRKKGLLDTIELSKDNIKLAEENFLKAGVSDKINLIEGNALAIMPAMEEKYDFIFLDADKEDYEKLFYYSLILLRRRGVIFIDNLLWHGYTASKNVPQAYKESTKHIRNFNNLFVTQKALHTTILPVGDGIGIGVKVD